MSARKRKNRRGVHEMLKQGLVNTSDGKWVPAKSAEAEGYAKRADLNAKRNRRNRERRREEAAQRWQVAVAAAKSVLQKEGDTSKPLDWFVASHLPAKRRRRK